METLTSFPQPRRLRLLLAASALTLAYASLLAPPASALGPFAKLSAEMTEPRYAPAMATLPNGKVLVSGGYAKGGPPAADTAELFDPASGTFAKLAAAPTVGRGEDCSATLPDGRVLIAGGANGVTSLKSAEVFNPKTEAFETVGEMTIQRDGCAAAMLPDGKVLIVDGVGNNKASNYKQAELFNPTTNTFESITAETPAVLYYPAAVSLADGKILIAGGYKEAEGKVTANAELFDPTTSKFEPAAHELLGPREEAASVPAFGGALLLGGYGTSYLSSVELFNIGSGSFEKPGSELTEARDGDAAARLQNGSVLVLGGYRSSTYLRSAELAPPTLAVTTGGSPTAGTVSGVVLSEIPLSIHFQYGTSTAYGSSTAPQALTPSMTPVAVGATLSGLLAGTTYHYRLVAEDAAGPIYGADMTFTTAPAPPAPIAPALFERCAVAQQVARGQRAREHLPPSQARTDRHHVLLRAQPAGHGEPDVHAATGRAQGEREVRRADEGQSAQARMQPNGHRRNPLPRGAQWNGQDLIPGTHLVLQEAQARHLRCDDRRRQRHRSALGSPAVHVYHRQVNPAAPRGGATDRRVAVRRVNACVVVGVALWLSSVAGASASSAIVFCSGHGGALRLAGKSGKCGHGQHALTLASAGALGAAQQEVSSLRATVASQQSELAALKSQAGSQQGGVGSLQSAVSALQSTVTALSNTLAGFSRVGNTLRLTGMNLQIVSGSGKTGGAVNGLGNLIIGYNEEPGTQTGSHNLVLGDGQAFTSFGGLIAGQGDSLSAPFAVALGDHNTAGGEFASVTGGEQNEAQGEASSVVGGDFNLAAGSFSSVVGGCENLAGPGSTPSGSCSTGAQAVLGGFENTASGLESTVSGGEVGSASGGAAAVSGGQFGIASGGGAAVAGGDDNSATGSFSAILGGFGNAATTFDGTVVGGESNTASATSSTVLGGNGNTASSSCQAIPAAPGSC